MVLKPGVATHLCVAKILRCVAKIEHFLKLSKKSITAITLKVFADGYLLIALTLSIYLCTKDIIALLAAFLSNLMGSIWCIR